MIHVTLEHHTIGKDYNNYTANITDGFAFRS